MPSPPSRRTTADLIASLKRAEESLTDDAARLRAARYALQGRKIPGRKPVKRSTAVRS